jgi:hypothetical protein
MLKPERGSYEDKKAQEYFKLMNVFLNLAKFLGLGGDGEGVNRLQNINS